MRKELAEYDRNKSESIEISIRNKVLVVLIDKAAWTKSVTQVQGVSNDPNSEGLLPGSDRLDDPS